MNVRRDYSCSLLFVCNGFGLFLRFSQEPEVGNVEGDLGYSGNWDDQASAGDGVTSAEQRALLDAIPVVKLKAV
jgi:hypothetical protein